MKPADICCIASQWFQHSFHCPQHLNDRDLWIARGPLNCLCLGHSPPPVITTKPKKTRTLFKLNFDPQVMAVAVRGPAGVPPDRFDAPAQGLHRDDARQRVSGRRRQGEVRDLRGERPANPGAAAGDLRPPGGSCAQDRGIAAKIPSLTRPCRLKRSHLVSLIPAAGLRSHAHS